MDWPESPFALPDHASGSETMADAAREIVAAGRRMDRLGFLPATAGNLSRRLSSDRFAITRSGGHKGFLTEADVIEVGLDGQAVRAGDRPSAETLLHCQIYEHDPEAQAILHGHSLAATVLSRFVRDTIVLEGYEVQKVFAGQTTHTAAIRVSVFDNDQDIPRLARNVAPLLNDMPAGYVIRGHGVYVWGPNMKSAMARMEGLEFLLACTLHERSLAR